MASTESFVSIYDVRYTGEPLFRFGHYSDENPPNILGIGEPYNPFNDGVVNEVEDLQKLLLNLELDDFS